MFFLGMRTHKNYVENPEKRVLYFAIGLIGLGFASLFAALEKTSLVLLLHPIFPIIFYVLQTTMNSVGYISINLFCLRVVFPKLEQKILTINIILASLDLIFVLIFLPTPIYTTYEMALPDLVAITQMIFGFPIILMIPILLFYYSYTTKKQSPPHSQKSFLLGMATIFIFLILYVKLFVPIEFADLTRLLWIPAFIFWYLVFTSFIEADWPKKILHLFVVMEKSGLCLHDSSFKSENMVERQLLGSSISGISELLQELTKSKYKLKFMDQGDVKIIIEYGNRVNGILITEANFNILRKKLKKLVEEFELKYEDLLVKFKGSLNEFKNAGEIVKKIFSYKEFLDPTVFK